MSTVAPKTKLLFPNDIFRSEHFEAWLEENRPTLVRSASNWVGHDAAEDCVQHAGIVAWQCLSRLPHDCSVSHFLKFFYGKLRDACRTHLQQCKRRNEIILEPQEVLSLAERMSTDSTIALPDISPAYYDLLRDRLYELLHRATLTNLQETCIRQWLDGVTQSGIAKYLDIDQSAVSRHISAGVERLRTALHWEEPVEKEIADFFWECVKEASLSVYRRPSRSRKKFRLREKKDEAAA